MTSLTSMLLLCLVLVTLFFSPSSARKHEDRDHDDHDDHDEHDDHDKDDDHSSSLVPSIPEVIFNATSKGQSALRRVGDHYVYIWENGPLQMPIYNSWAITTVNSKIQAQLKKKQLKQQQKMLQKQIEKIEWREQYAGSSNATHAMSHPHSNRHHKNHHGFDFDKMMTKSYLAHTQCRRCTRDNYNIVTSSSLASISQLYSPLTVMKWCSRTQGVLKSELGMDIHKTQAPLADWEGYCVDATVACPTNTVDMNILSPAVCSNDEPTLKSTCSLCVLDGYIWNTNNHAMRVGDNYDGQCTENVTSSLLVNQLNSLRITEDSECPASLKIQAVGTKINMVGTWVGIGTLIMAGLCCCTMVRCCCIKGIRARKQAALNKANAEAAASVVPATPSFVASAYPAHQASSAPAQSAVAQPNYSINQHAEPLLSTNASIVPRPAASYPLAYPVVSPQPTAPPAYGYYRM